MILNFDTISFTRYLRWWFLEIKQLVQNFQKSFESLFQIRYNLHYFWIEIIYSVVEFKILSKKCIDHLVENCY